MSFGKIYIETSVISYYVARPNRDLITSSRQELTRRWWLKWLPDSEPLVSIVVDREIREGDPAMVQSRLQAISGFGYLAPIATIDEVFAKVAAKRILPANALDDLAHLTFSAVHGVPVVVTWNFRHLANPAILRQLRKAFGKLDLVLPEVFTPEQLLSTR